MNLDNAELDELLFIVKDLLCVLKAYSENYRESNISIARMDTYIEIIQHIHDKACKHF